jgi:hypothetical protein
VVPGATARPIHLIEALSGRWPGASGVSLGFMREGAGWLRMPDRLIVI